MEYLCPGCNTKFRQSEELLSHFLAAHMGGGVKRETFSCEDCNKRFDRKEDLEQHFKDEHHIEEKPTWTEEIITNGDELIVTCMPDNDAGEVKAREQKHICTVCGSSFMNARGLRTHVESAHSGELVLNSNCDLGEDSIEKCCRDCGKRFSSKYNLDRHLQLHKGVRYPCIICGKVYSQKYAWGQHMKLTHKEWKEPSIRSGERTWRIQERCPYCSEYFPTMTEIETHMRDMHCIGSGSEAWR